MYPSYCSASNICAGSEITFCPLQKTCSGKSKGQGSRYGRNLIEDNVKTIGKERQLRYTHFTAATGGPDKIPETGIVVCINGEDICLDPLDPKDVVSSRTKGATCGLCDGT